MPGLVLGGIAILLVAGTTFALRTPAQPSVETLVSRIEEFTGTFDSFRYAGTGVAVTVLNEIPPRTSEAGFSTEGAEFAGRRHIRTVYDSRAVEVVEDSRRTLVRVAQPATKLAEIKWQVNGAKKGQPTVPTGPAVGRWFRDLKSRVEGASVVRWEGASPVLRLTVPPDNDPDAAIDYLDYEAELTVSTAGEPRRLVERSRYVDPASGRVVKRSLELRFSGWGQPVDLAVPRDSQIEPATGVDAAAVGAYPAAPVLQPGGIPPGWVLSYAGVIEAARTAEGCDQVELDYLWPENRARGYLYLWQFDVPCADMAVPGGALAVRIGGHEGWIMAEGREARAQMVVGPTVVQVVTDLSLEGLVRILQGLVPLDLSQPPPAVPGLS